MERLNYAESVLIKFLSYRPRSQKEIEVYLKKKGCSADEITVLIDKYANMGYIDDLEFAKMWIRDRMKFNPKGYNAIRAELVAKGIEIDIIELAWKDMALDEQDIARSLINRKFNKSDKQSMSKAIAFLLRRGFKPSLAINIVKEFFDKGGEDLS